MKISFLLMSRGRPALFQKCYNLLIDKAAHKDQIEIICRLDQDDIAVLVYLREHLLNVTFIVGPRLNGYLSFGTMIDQCAKLATGDLLWQWGDDALMESDGYDAICESKGVPSSGVFVMSSELSSNVCAGDYRFGFFAIPRKLYELNGSFSLGERFGYDRVYDAISRYLDCEVNSGVRLRHEYQNDQTAREGLDKSTAELNPKRNDFFSMWDTLGKQFADKIRARV